MKTSTLERKLTVKELAEQLGWTEVYIRELVGANVIPHLRIPGVHGGRRGRVYSEPSKVAAWLASCERGASETPARSRSEHVDRTLECEDLGIPVNHRYA